MRIAIIALAVASLAMLGAGNPSLNITSKTLIFAVLLIAATFGAYRLRRGDLVGRLSATLPLVAAASWALAFAIVGVIYTSIYGLHVTSKITSLALFVPYVLSPIEFALMGILAFRARSAAPGIMLPAAVVLGLAGGLSQFAWIAYANH